MSASITDAAASAMVRGQTIEIDYTNYRGRRGTRRIEPQRIWFGSTDYHREPQWLMDAFDLGRAAIRTFALRDIHGFD